MKNPAGLSRELGERSGFPGSNDSFVLRHIGPRPSEVPAMLKTLGYPSLDELMKATVPPKILTRRPLDLGPGRSEHEALDELRDLACRNQVFRNFLGMGYSGTLTPPVIQRNILENPGWYTQYTPYQAEIAQGRLEALLNFQQLVMDLTALPIANASMLDEATAAAEAMGLCFALKNRPAGGVFFVAETCHPQTIEVVRTRARPLGVEVVIGDPERADFASKPVFGALVQYPDTHGVVHDYRAFIERVHKAGALAVMAADCLALTLLTPPGELGADIAVGSTQRFGVPMGYGGPHAAYFATRDEYKRLVPGRFVGVSKDVDGKNAYRLALQTREQHIRRDKATSNICTAQVLLGVIASMYAVYHGPEGLKQIAERVHALATLLARGLERLGLDVGSHPYFDTIRVQIGKGTERSAEKIVEAARASRINLRLHADGQSVGIALDETHSPQDVADILALFAQSDGRRGDGTSLLEGLAREPQPAYPPALSRKSAFLTHSVFNKHHSETEMLRYMRKLESRDLSLAFSMIPLGSCTMKLNATAEMFPVTWPEFGALHPFAPREQAQGYETMFRQLQKMLAEITGFAGVSLQPNAGSQGEYTGLLVIRAYQESKGEGQRDVCLIPKSAHGTNPASAAMVGLRVVVVETDEQGNIDVADLKAKAAEHKAKLSCLMATYPSTHGVFEEAIGEICQIVHENGGQVYIDGANMNAQIGFCRPGEFGGDVCHLNLHKTFCIPHGGGGPGMGPIGVREHLLPFLPGHPVIQTGGEHAIGAVSAAPWGSASILPISWMYITMMGSEGLRRATELAVLNANYIAHRLSKHFPILYKGKKGNIAHECIFDCRAFKDTAGIEVEDIAKRLMDYGFHAPTISFPVAGTIMVEPTESEPREELDRFCEAMILIRAEIAELEQGKGDRANNPLKNAPHTAEQIARSDWNHPYTRERAAFPAPWLREHKFWPAVGRINNVLGDRVFVCSCPPLEA
jgi:glycine dehydrogenase